MMLVGMAAKSVEGVENGGFIPSSQMSIEAIDPGNVALDAKRRLFQDITEPGQKSEKSH